jgi:tetratricopeptide (TPR) repeat protein
MNAAATTSAEENSQELAALCRMLTRSSGFRLGFVVANHPSLRRRIALDCERTCGVRPREVTLDGRAPEGIVTQLERAIGEDQPTALFVYGLESLLDLRLRQSPAMDLLNLNRDYCWQRFPWPVVFVAPLFAVREFARQTPDFWSGRTGVYRFTGDRDDIKETLAGLGIGYDWSLEASSKLERREILDHLRAELDDRPDEDPAIRVELLSLLARAAAFAHDWPRQQQLLTQTLPIYRQIGARLGEANTIKGLGDVALAQSRYQEATERYQQALPTYRQTGDRLGEAHALQGLGGVALQQVRFQEATEHHQQALPIYRQIGDRRGEAQTIQGLGDAALWQSRYQEATNHYQQALPIYRQIGNRLGEAYALQGLGDVALAQGRSAEAAEHYQQALPIYRQVGDRLGEANTLVSRARLAITTGKRADAVSEMAQAIHIYTAIGLTKRAETLQSEVATWGTTGAEMSDYSE